MEGPCAHPCPFTGSSDGVALWAQTSLDVLYWRASKQRNDPLKDFFPGLVWKCARPHVCAHLPESERSLLGLYVLVVLCVSRVTQQSGGVQPPPQHLARRHLIKACFSEYLELSECPVYIERCCCGAPRSQQPLCLPVGCLAGVCKAILLGGKDISGTFVECFKCSFKSRTQQR